jgi:hypothetical protein
MKCKDGCREDLLISPGRRNQSGLGNFFRHPLKERSNAMTEDLLDHWVGLIKPFFPPNAWVVARYSGDDHIIEIDWKLDDDAERYNRRSRKIQITISAGAIEDYLDKNKEERKVFEINLKKLIHERYNSASPDQQVHADSTASMDKLVIARDTLNAQ